MLDGVVFDSSIASTLLDPTKSRRLEDLAKERLGYTASSSTLLPAESADIALQLYIQMSGELSEKGMASLMTDIEGPLVEVLSEMETNGIICDPVELRRQGADLALRADALKLAIFEAAGLSFELGSTRQVAEVLFEKLKLPSGKKTKTGYSTDVEVLEKLASMEDASIPHTSVPRLILEHRQLAKLISTYLGNLVDAIDPADGRIYTTFVQLGAATGRLGSNNPNLQNIPIRTAVGKQIRKAFLAPPGSLLISADYSQIELRVLAHLSGDPAMLRAFESDEDVHVAVASEVFGIPLADVSKEQRNHAKMINYAIVYGVTPFGLSRRIEGMDVAAAADLIGRYRKNFSGVDVFLQECIEQARSKGYVSTISGRRRLIPEIDARQPNIRQLGERLAINSVVQGSAADLIKKAMVDLLRQIRTERLPLKMLLQIHDELVLEAPESDAQAMGKIVVDAMERAMKLTVPLKAECGIASDWMSTK
jgi:DNA polymerase-1